MKVGILNKALEEIKKIENTDYSYRIGVVIFKGSRIFTTGYNSVRSSSIPPQYKKFPNTLHAEQAAIYNAPNKNNLKGASILIIRSNKCGTISMGYPCEYCLETIKHYGIKNIYYSNRDGEIIREKI